MAVQKKFNNYDVLVRDVLNFEYGLSLLPNSDQGIDYNFIDAKKHTYVSIEKGISDHFMENMVEGTNQIMKYVSNGVSLDILVHVFLVVDSELDRDDHNYFHNNVHSRKNRKFTVLGSSEIRDIAIKYNIDWRKFIPTSELIEKRIKQLSRQKETVYKEERNLFDIEKTSYGKKREYYAVGHLWDGGEIDNLDRFIKDSIWEDGHNGKNQGVINGITAHSILFMKSSFNGTLRIKAIGFVLINHQNGRTLRVNWHRIPNQDFPKLGGFRNAISRMVDETIIKKILQGLVNKIPNLYEIIESLEHYPSTPIYAINYWWLTISKSTRIDNWKEGQERRFIFSGFLSRPKEFQEIVREVKKEDVGVIFHPTENGRMQFIFRVLDVHEAGQLTFELVKEFKGEAKKTLEELKSLPLFKNSQVIKENNRGTLLKLSQKEFNEIKGIEKFNNLDDNEITENNDLTSAILNNDGAPAPIDLLDFENDIRAFSVTLAQKKMKPPMAVALFGEWGTGKSFFMHHLEQKIKFLSVHQGFKEGGRDFYSDEETKPFCEGVVQIKFNAWSYLDANLWAGLVANIFEKLDHYITNSEAGEKEKLEIYQIIASNLNIAKEEKTVITKERNDLEKEKKELEDQIAILREGKDLMYNSMAVQSLEDLKKEARNQTVELEQLVKSELDKYGISEQRVLELTPSSLLDEVSSWVTFAKNLGKFNSKSAYTALIIFAFFLLIWFDPGSYLLVMKKYVADSYLIFIGIAGPMFLKVYDAYNKYKTVLNPVIEYKNKFNEKFEKIKLDYETDLISKETSIAQKNQQIKQKEDELKETEVSIEEHEFAIKHSITKRAFIDFIKRKASDESYEKHIGLISIIRRDFETLSNLFGEVIIPKNLTKEEQELWDQRKMDSDRVKELLDKPLDRIILYIDDLDRCSDDKVLEVLQAVHLLMAFPLFIVVVGVDKRCVSNALRYRNILQYGKTVHLENPDDLKKIYKIEVIQPEEYLEKIFQIPFNLKMADSDSIKEMIGNILKDDIQKVVVKETTKVNPESESTNSSTKSNETPRGIKTKKNETNTDDGEIINPSPDDLKLTITELECLKETSILVGNTPRTVKRFINIYRIIRTHEQPNYRTDQKEKDYLLIMFLLAIGIGKYSENAKLFFDDCLQTKQKMLKTILAERKETKMIVSHIEGSKVLKPLLNVRSKEFNKFIYFVSRFTFNG